MYKICVRQRSCCHITLYSTYNLIAWRLNSSISLILPIKFSIKILFYSATKYTFYKLMADYINVFALQRFERTGVWAALRESSYGGMRESRRQCPKYNKKCTYARGRAIFYCFLGSTGRMEQPHRRVLYIIVSNSYKLHALEPLHLFVQ